MQSLKSEKIIKIILVIAGFLIAIYLSGFYRWIDTNLFNERMKDLSGRFLFREDWSEISFAKEKFDYSWLGDEEPILIAHALGAPGLPSQNTLSEMAAISTNGLRFMEVDLWLDDKGKIRCHHGPDRPSQFKKGDCTFEEALDLAKNRNLWLVLDIKTDFKQTGEEIFKRVNKHDSKRIIFQLYRPEHAKAFRKWHQLKPFAGPIITLYLARRSANHVQEKLLGSSFEVLTVPTNRLGAVNFQQKQVKILTHPVHNCEKFHDLKKYKLDGLYVTNRISQEIKAGCS